MNRAQRVLAFLEERPDTWIEATRFEPLGGRQAWRTAISEARTLAKAKGWDIVNRLHYIREHTADCPGKLAWDIPEACSCGKPERWTLSEYMISNELERAVVSQSASEREINEAIRLRRDVCEDAGEVLVTPNVGQKNTWKKRS